MLSRSLALAILFASTAGVTAAQPSAFRVERATVAQGLVSERVLSILQDRRGFVWAGTLDGLSRYDGYTFTNFRRSPLDSTSLPGDVVYALYEGRNGALWVGTSGGLGRLDRSTGRFANRLTDRDFVDQPWANDVGYLLEDRKGDLWLGTFGGGLYRMDGRTGALTHYRHDPEDTTSLSFDVVQAIVEDRAGALWVSTMNGLNRFEPETGTFTRFLHPTGDRYEGSAVAFVEDAEDDGVFWLSTITGLVRFESATGAVRRYIDFRSSESLQGGPWWSMPQGMAWDPHAPGVLWVAAPREGLYRLDTGTGTRTSYKHAPGDPYSLSGEPHVVSAAAGLIWVGTDRGLDRFDAAPAVIRTHAPGEPGAPPLLHRNVTAVHAGRSGALWVGTGDFLVGTALTRIDGRSGAATHWQPPPTAPAGLPDNISVNAVLERRDGSVWVGTTPRRAEPALTLLDPARGTARSWSHDSRKPDGIGPGAVQVLLEDQSGALWVGTSKGYLSRMKGDRFEHFVAVPGDSTGFLGGSVRRILEDAAGRLWIGTDRGLSRLDPGAGTFVRYTHRPGAEGGLSGNDVFAVYERRAEPGVIWVSTNAGLDRLDARTGRATLLSRGDGLPRHPVVSIVEDGKGLLWLSTAGPDLVRLDPATMRLALFDETSGLRARRFNLGAAAASASTGEVLVGSAEGLIAFDPDAMGSLSGAPPVVLTDFKLFGQSVPVGGRSLLQAPIWETEEVRLPYSQNAVSFDFVALHFKNPARTRYAYRLEGLDDGWIPAGDRRTAAYTNLSPGTYVFRVRAASSEGVWSESGASVRLVILPPWWRTWWAYTLFCSTLVGFVMLADKLRQRQVARRERTRSLIREKELRVEAAEASARYLESENRRQTQELESARALQLSMLPKRVPDHPLVELAAYMRTATEVGGDYYDFAEAEDGTLTVVLGDATGHGTQAGTLVAVTKGILNVLAKEEDLGRVLKTAGEAVRAMRIPKLYMALAIGRLRGSELELIGGGLPPALLYREATGEILPVSLKGLPLGAPGVFPYHKHRIRLAPGDTVVLMSDGLPELRNEAGEMLGYERMASTIAAVAGREPEAVIAHIVETAESWSGGRALSDDLTFVVLRAKAEIGATVADRLPVREKSEAEEALLPGR